MIQSRKYELPRHRSKVKHGKTDGSDNLYPWEFSLTKYTTDDTDGGADGSTDDAAETGTICAKVFAAVTVEEWDDQIRVSMPQPFPPSRVVHRRAQLDLMFLSGTVAIRRRAGASDGGRIGADAEGQVHHRVRAGRVPAEAAASSWNVEKVDACLAARPASGRDHDALS